MEKKLTILDIATLSGVGKSTVSRFFNNGYVSQEAREKIQKVIEENSYAPNVFARGIKAKNNKFIGIIVPCLRFKHNFQYSYGFRQHFKS